METVEIREAEVGDTPSLLRLRWDMCVENGEADPQNEILRRKYERTYREFLEQYLELPQCQFWLALLNGEIIATATLWLVPLLPWPANLNEAHGYITNLYTVPNYRRLGIATQMLETLRQVAVQNKVSTLLLQPSPTATLYSRLGYQPTNYVKLEL